MPLTHHCWPWYVNSAVMLACAIVITPHRRAGLDERTATPGLRAGDAVLHRAARPIRERVLAVKGLNLNGIDEGRSGLPCRSSIQCREIFRVPLTATLPDLLAVGRTRDAHELAAHGYVHVVVPLAHSYQAGFSRRGRSML